jgi:hypothetical protein
MKFSAFVFLAALAAPTMAFVPSQPRVYSRSAVFMSEEAEEPVVAAPAPAPAPKVVKETAIVPIKEETVEFTAGILGGLAGFAVGGPVLGAIFAAAANYASKNENEVGEVMSAVSKTSIEVYNYLAKLDTKYEVLDKAKGSLEKALDKLKAQGGNAEAVDKVEKALKTTTSKISELNDEYDLVGGGVTALGVIGDLVEKAVKRFGELNEEYALTSKATEALKGAIDKAKAAANK